MARIEPLPKDHTPELANAFAVYERSLGFVPNSMLILQRRPKMVQALSQLAAAVWDDGNAFFPDSGSGSADAGYFSDDARSTPGQPPVSTPFAAYPKHSKVASRCQETICKLI